MVFGMSAPEAPVPPPGFAATAPESPTLDPWAGAAADPWANAALTLQPPQLLTQPEADLALDAFGKGKGKAKTDGGKGRGPLGCWNCFGEGHPSFSCPSAKGAGKAG